MASKPEPPRPARHGHIWAYGETTNSWTEVPVLEEGSRDMVEPNDLDIRAFKKAANTLARLGRKGLYIYLAMDTLYLMTGPSHDFKLRRCDDRVRASVNIPLSGGGDW